MPDIVLATLNAKYIHSAFGLRYLVANMGDLQDRTTMLEFDLNQRPVDIAERILARRPRILGLGVYIWNARASAELVALLRRVGPGLTVVLGGPEVSFETDDQAIVRLADYTICGEGDLEFAWLCRKLLNGERPAHQVHRAALPDLRQIALPYAGYGTEDIAHRLLYVEASRGCPFGCEFCLSSLDNAVRQFPRAPLFAALEDLLRRGGRHFKFVDRTFNLNPTSSQAILDFFLERLRPGLFLHFEVVPDRLPESLRDRLRRFPPGTLQLEAGIQTFNEEVARRIHRHQDIRRIEDNLRFLREETHAHVHADLIAGLPGEDLASFATGFDRLVRLKPQEIQVGILKRLRGTSITRHDETCGMVYAPEPPYEILRTAALDFPTVQRLKRFARFWDLISNSGNFVESTPLLWSGGASPFESFLAFSDWLHTATGQRHGIALPRLMEFLFRYLTQQQGLAPNHVAERLLRDYRRGGRSDTPPWIGPYASSPARPARSAQAGRTATRQQRHRGG